MYLTLTSFLSILLVAPKGYAGAAAAAETVTETPSFKYSVDKTGIFLQENATINANPPSYVCNPYLPTHVNPWGSTIISNVCSIRMDNYGCLYLWN